MQSKRLDTLPQCKWPPSGACTVPGGVSHRGQQGPAQAAAGVLLTLHPACKAWGLTLPACSTALPALPCGAECMGVPAPGPNPWPGLCGTSLQLAQSSCLRSDSAGCCAPQAVRTGLNAQQQGDTGRVTVILLTDGRANVSLAKSNEDPEALKPDAPKPTKVGQPVERPSLAAPNGMPASPA